MIIGTVTLLLMFFGGGGTFSFEKAFDPFLKEAVKDESRYEQVVDLCKEADLHNKQFQTEVNDVWAKELKTLFADYSTSEKQFRAFVKKADQSRIALQKDLLAVRMKMTKVITEDEWNAMYAAVDKAAEEELKKKEEKDK